MDKAPPALRLEEDLAEVGSVNKGVAHGAGLVLLRLVVGRPDRRLRRRVAHRQSVALQAQQIDLADAQQARIRRAVRSVAAHATLGLHRQVLENEWSLLLGVTLEAHLVLLRAGTELFRAETPVWVMTVRTLHQALIHPVPERPAEFRFFFRVAAVTKLRLGGNQQGTRSLCMMRRMAGETSDVVFRMRGPEEIGVFGTGSMTGEAALVGLFCRQIFKRNDLRLVAAAFDVGRARAMTILATVLAGFDQRVVRRVRKSLIENIFVTCLAGIGADVTGRR